jgi:hypothetical protein
VFRKTDVGEELEAVVELGGAPVALEGLAGPGREGRGEGFDAGPGFFPESFDG